MTTAKHDRFPMRALASAIALTLLFVVIAVINTWRMYSGFRQLASTELRLVEVVGKIAHLDEVLTMSARMSAVSGDLSWERRYRRHERELDAAIKESIRIAPDAYATHAASATDAANVALVAMETRAFELVRSGKPERAREIMFGAEYERQKKIYADGIGQTMSSLKRRADDRITDYGRELLASLIVALIILGSLSFGWIRVIRVVRSYLNARNTAVSELERVNASLEQRVDERTRDLAQSLEQLKEAQGQVVASARAAGMAEVAAGVLHNVGNVLNSVNVSARLARDLVTKCRIASLQKAARLLLEGKDDAAFLTSDRGRVLPAFVAGAADEIAGSVAQAAEELDALQAHVDHIKKIVGTQQTYARVRSHVETFDLAEAVAATIQLSAPNVAKASARVVSHIERGTTLKTDKHRVVQILLNLIANGCHAVREAPQARRTIEISSQSVANRVRLLVTDHGMGIDHETMKQLFRHGFTTRKDGHGFGLHSSANAATELGGTLRADSAGRDQGATFTLEIPSQMPARPAIAA